MYESDSPDLIFTRDPVGPEEEGQQPQQEKEEGGGGVMGGAQQQQKGSITEGESIAGKQEHPGKPISLTTQALNVGAAAYGNFAPVNKICQHLCAFHFYAHDMTRQVEAHHYCSHLNEDMRQCLIYDSDEPNARLIGVEYVISESLFQTLPEEERQYWHSHVYEVMSGILYCPTMPEVVENQVMKNFVRTYGKTWHFWQVDKGHPLPYGPPQLMMAFKEDGTLDMDLLAKRDAKYDKWTDHLRRSRESSGNIEPPDEVLPGADGWDKTGKTLQVKMEEVEMKRK